jgi:hypothetical protein
LCAAADQTASHHWWKRGHPLYTIMAILGAPLVPLLASLLPYLLPLFLLYILSLSVYRLFLSPIAHIPGPRLAALTSLYEFYYDCILGGQFYVELQRLHKQYGMMTARQLLSHFSVKGNPSHLFGSYRPPWPQRNPHRRPRILRSNLQCNKQARQVCLVLQLRKPDLDIIRHR